MKSQWLIVAENAKNRASAFLRKGTHGVTSREDTGKHERLVHGSFIFVADTQHLLKVDVKELLLLVPR